MKTQKDAPETIDAYIARYPGDIQTILQKIRTIIRDAAPDATEAMKYQIPTFVLGENLVHFAGFAKHIGFYPTPSGIAQFQDELAKYPSAKGSVQFPLDQPIPYALIKKIVKYRVSEVRKKQAAKKPTSSKAKK